MNNLRYGIGWIYRRKPRDVEIQDVENRMKFGNEAEIEGNTVL